MNKMKAITHYELKVNLAEIQEILELKIEQLVNQHASCLLKGIINEKDKVNLVTGSLDKKELEITADCNGKIILFCGLVQKATIHETGGFYMAEIHALSYSVLTDIKKKSASYQDTNQKYEDIVRKIVRAYPSGDVKDFASEHKATGQLIVQYQETDWEFLKRLASHFNMGLIPNIILKGPKIMFGTFKGVARGEIKCYEYSVSKNLLEYQIGSENENPEISEEDVITYEVDILENYEIGDTAQYQGRTVTIEAKTIILVNDIIRFRYTLSSNKKLSVEKAYNDKITGVSLKGTVLKSVQDKVKVQLEIDKSQEEGTAYLFPYTTNYTAEGNSGWYCMPETGDTALIYFPTKDEGEAVSINSYRSGSGGNINDPTVKYFRTANGKELKFSPDEISITCVQGKDEKTGEDKIVYIKLNKDNGIEIMSTEPVSITSQKAITIDAEDKVEISANEYINLRCKKSQIRMDSKIDICGPDVRIN